MQSDKLVRRNNSVSYEKVWVAVADNIDSTGFRDKTYDVNVTPPAGLI